MFTLDCCDRGQQSTLSRRFTSDCPLSPVSNRLDLHRAMDAQELDAVKYLNIGVSINQFQQCLFHQ